DGIGVYVDVNDQCCDGAMNTVMNINPLDERLRAFGADVHKVDGHDVEALAAQAERPRTGKPLVVLAQTDPCRDIDLLRERAPKLHYVRFKSDSERQSYERALVELGRE
ncbi:MAG: transketolase, partial [Proteobacteria bacterium]|nr:transketolase [Pseudomonadota bacterium]